MAIKEPIMKTENAAYRNILAISLIMFAVLLSSAASHASQGMPKTLQVLLDISGNSVNASMDDIDLSSFEMDQSYDGFCAPGYMIMFHSKANSTIKLKVGSQSYVSDEKLFIEFNSNFSGTCPATVTAADIGKLTLNFGNSALNLFIRFAFDLTDASFTYNGLGGKILSTY
jgi:hypothetical protein